MVLATLVSDGADGLYTFPPVPHPDSRRQKWRTKRFSAPPQNPSPIRLLPPRISLWTSKACKQASSQSAKCRLGSTALMSEALHLNFQANLLSTVRLFFHRSEHQSVKPELEARRLDSLSLSLGGTLKDVRSKCFFPKPPPQWCIESEDAEARSCHTWRPAACPECESRTELLWRPRGLGLQRARAQHVAQTG